MSLTSDTMMTMPVVPAGMSGSGYGGGGNGLFGNDGALWLIVLFLFIFAGGWGRGLGGGNNNGSGGYSADIQRSFDNSAVVTKLDGITQGICDSTYALNNTLTTGFSNAELSRCNQQAAFMQQLNNMAMQAQQCCCDTREAIQGVNYNLATNTCALQSTMNTNTRDILENQNSNTRAILDYLCKDKIETLQAENQTLRLAASQSNQNAVLMAAMDANKAEILRRSGHDCPSAAYIVQPPTPVNFPTNGCGTFTGFNGGCGCGC